MFMITALSNTELETSFSDLVKEERKTTRQILEHIYEISRPKLFLEQGYSSLFEWLTKKYSYSNAAAQRRIDAARCLKLGPEVSEKIEKGKLNLSHLARLQATFRQEEKRSGKPLADKQKKELLKK